MWAKTRSTKKNPDCKQFEIDCATDFNVWNWVLTNTYSLGSQWNFVQRDAKIRGTFNDAVFFKETRSTFFSLIFAKTNVMFYFDSVKFWFVSQFSPPFFFLNNLRLAKTKNQCFPQKHLLFILDCKNSDFIAKWILKDFLDTKTCTSNQISEISPKNDFFPSGIPSSMKTKKKPIYGFPINIRQFGWWWKSQIRPGVLFFRIAEARIQQLSEKVSRQISFWTWMSPQSPR